MRAVQLTPELEDYIEGLLPARDEVLARMEHEAEAEGVPAVGPQEGMLLTLLARLGRPQRMLELGAAIGYSGIWLLRGSTQGRLITLESDPARAGRARANFDAAGVGDRVEVVEEDAIAWLGAHAEMVDLVFHDLLNSLASESVVERSFELCLGRLGPGGLLIADNALRRGQVVTRDNQQARNVAHWNHLVAAEDRLDGVIVPMRDGVSLAWLRD